MAGRFGQKLVVVFQGVVPCVEQVFHVVADDTESQCVLRLYRGNGRGERKENGDTEEQKGLMTFPFISVSPFVGCHSLSLTRLFDRNIFQNIQQVVPELLDGGYQHAFVGRVHALQGGTERNHVE